MIGDEERELLYKGLRGIWYDTRHTTSTAREEDKVSVKVKGIVKIFKAEVVGQNKPNISGEGFTSVEYEATQYYRRIIYLPYMPELALGTWVDIEISVPQG